MIPLNMSEKYYNITLIINFKFDKFDLKQYNVIILTLRPELSHKTAIAMASTTNQPKALSFNNNNIKRPAKRTMKPLSDLL